MKLAVDIDDVLAEFVPHFLAYYNTLFGTAHQKEDLYTYDFIETLQKPISEILKAVNSFYNTPIIEMLPPLEGSQKAMKSLVAERIVSSCTAITSRPAVIKERTEHWLHANYNGALQRVEYMNTYGVYENRRTKAATCKKLGISLIVEDAPDHVAECVREGVTVLLFDQPWNRNVEANNEIIRVHSWEEVNEEVRRYRKLR